MASLDENAVLRSDSLQAQLDRLEDQKKALGAELEAAPAPEPRFHANLAELYRQKVERLHESLSAPQDRTGDHGDSEGTHRGNRPPPRRRRSGD
jgi:hypothetical protein